MRRFKEILDDNTFSGIVVILDNKSNIIDANEEFLGLLNYTLDDISGKHISDLIVPDEKPLFMDMVFTQDISNVITIKFYHKSGAYRFFSFSILKFETHMLLIGNTLKKDFLAKKFEYLSKDKTKIEEVFENIEVNDIRELLSFDDNPLSLLLDLMPVEIWVKDKIGKYVFVNETYTLATGVSIEECLMKDDFQLFSIETAKSFVETDGLAISSGKKISYSFENNDENFASFAEVTKIPIYNNSGIYIGMLGFSVNTSHSKATEILLENEKNRLLFILENVEGLIFEINYNGKLEFISGKLRRLLGNIDDYEGFMNHILENSENTEVKEKISLALNGKRVQLSANVMGLIIDFNLNPVLNPDGTYNIVGFGNAKLNGGESNE